MFCFVGGVALNGEGDVVPGVTAYNVKSGKYLTNGFESFTGSIARIVFPAGSETVAQQIKNKER